MLDNFTVIYVFRTPDVTGPFFLTPKKTRTHRNNVRSHEHAQIIMSITFAADAGSGSPILTAYLITVNTCTRLFSLSATYRSPAPVIHTWEGYLTNPSFHPMPNCFPRTEPAVFSMTIEPPF